MTQPIMFMQIPFVDKWNPEPQDILFTNSKNIIATMITKFYHIDNDSRYSKLNYFMVNPKKSYNSDDLRNHLCLYLNYFEKYFDPDKEYYTNLAHIKFIIDCYQEYHKENLIYDLNRYILQPSLFDKVNRMVDYNYKLELSYKSANNPQLQYTNDHAKAFMGVSILMNLCIPIITHFAYLKRIDDIDEYLLDIYDYILYAPIFKHVNIPSKLYETAISNVIKNEKNNAIIWAKQDIRGKDTVTHSKGAVRNIILNIIPKYTFDQNMVSLNYTSIQKSNKFQVTDIAYEYSYIPLSSSKRDDEDNASEMDKYEANLIRTNEALYLQSKCNSDFSMQRIIKEWGPFNEEEVHFYLKELRNEKGEIINGFQKQLVFNLFYKYFGDTASINAINVIDYVKLILAAKKMLSDNMMGYFPYIISSKVQKIVSRKILNKREQIKMEQSQFYPLVMEKYKNEKILKQILSTIATIITSTFTIIDFEDPELHGREIIVEPDMIIEEVLLYILLI